MCRLLAVQARAPFDPTPYLQALAAIARSSKEYQGHGWGFAWHDNRRWSYYHDINPVWEDDLTRFSPTRRLLAHARSAFRDEGIVVENNMPFGDEQIAFIFNGELRGVRLRAPGRIGAEKIFNFIRRFDHGDLHAGTEKGVSIIADRSRYVRAMNLVLARAEGELVASTRFGEDPAYFTLHKNETPDRVVLSSEPFSTSGHWQPLANPSTEVWT